MKLYSWNVNGIRAVLRKDAMMPFIQREQPDILALQETKAEQHQADVGLPEYEQHWNSAGRKGYSGTAIFSKIKPLAVINGFTDKIVAEHKLAADEYGDPTSEGRMITAEFEKFYLVNVYTPNSKRELTRLGLRHKHWDPAFLKHMALPMKSVPAFRDLWTPVSSIRFVCPTGATATTRGGCNGAVPGNGTSDGTSTTLWCLPV